MSGYIQSPQVSYGRRSRKPLGVIIRKLSNGLDDVNGYFPRSDDEFEVDEEISEDDDGKETGHVENGNTNDDISSMSSEEELCKEEKIKIINDQIERTSEDRSPVSFKEDFICDVRNSNVNSLHARPGHDSKFGDSILGTVPLKDFAKPSTPKRRSNGMNSAESFKNNFTLGCPLPNDAFADGKMMMTPKVRSSSTDYRLSMSPGKSFSVIRTTLDTKNIPRKEAGFSSKGYQSIETEASQNKEGVNVYLSKENSEVAQGNVGLGLIRGRPKQRKRSMKDIAVSTNDLRHDYDGDHDDNYTIYDNVGNEVRYQINNSKNQTRFIVVERKSDRLLPNEEIERKRLKQNDSRLSTLRGRKFAARDPRYSVLNRNRKPVALRKQSLSSSEDDRLDIRANIDSKKVKIKASRGREGARQQLQEKTKKTSATDEKKRLKQSNETEEKAFTKKNSNASRPDLQPDRKERRRRRKKITFPSKRKSKIDKCTEVVNDRMSKEDLDRKSDRTENEHVVKNISNGATPLRNSLQCRSNINDLETPRSRSSSWLTSPSVYPLWTGPSPHSTENTSPKCVVGGPHRRSHPITDRRKSTSSKFVVGDDVNTLPGGSHSEHECETIKQKDERMKEKEKPRLVKKRRRYTRVCFPGTRKRNAKTNGGPQKVSPRKYKVECGEEVSKSTPKIESEDDEAATMNKNGEHSNIEKDKRSSKASKAAHDKLYANIPPSMLVRDGNDNFVRMNLVFTRAMLRLTTPGKLPDGRDFSHFFLHKFFEQPLFNAGIFVLLPLAEKGHQFVQNDTLVFLVISGEIEFIIENMERRLGPESHFFVPCGNAYNIKNVTQEKAMLFYVQIKGKDKNISSS